MKPEDLSVEVQGRPLPKWCESDWGVQGFVYGFSHEEGSYPTRIFFGDGSEVAAHGTAGLLMLGAFFPVPTARSSPN